MWQKLLRAGRCRLNFLQQWGNALSDQIPQQCLLCGSEQSRALCPDCEADFFGVQPCRCPQCALPLLAAAAQCGQCLASPPAFNRTIVACDYTPPLDQLVLALKFGHQLSAAPVMARQIGRAIRAQLAQHDYPQLLLPVPLGPERLRQRGFNQAMEIGRPLARLLNLPCHARLLQRTRDTTAQSMLHPAARQQNIQAAFDLADTGAASLKGVHIGVIDDVITTGATLQEIAICLLRHGALRVTNLIFARTLPHH